MKYSSYDQIEVVSSASPAEFQTLFNSKMQEHAAQKPRVEFVHREGLFCAYIIYEFEVRIPETVEDEYELQGIRYRCKDCPLHEPETDGRRRSYECRYSDLARTGMDSCACEVFYRALKRGEIKPIGEEVER